MNSTFFNFLNLYFCLPLECLLDQKATLNCIDYDSNSFQPNINVITQAIVPANKVQFGASSDAASLPSAADYQLNDGPSLILQQLTPPQSPPQFDAYKQAGDAQPKPVLVKAEQKVVSHDMSVHWI